MKNKFLKTFLPFISGSIFAQGYIGINTNTPKAALDIKTAKAGQEVMRVSTIPINITDIEKPFILLAGIQDNQGGYALRQLPVSELFDMIKKEVPSMSRIVLTNSQSYNFPLQPPGSNVDNNKEIPLKTLISNTDNTLFKFDASEGSIEILETGFYDVTSWIGVKSIPNIENEFVLSLGRKKVGENVYTNFKRAIVTRSENGITYDTAKEGIGASFSFVDKFEKGDKIITRINAVHSNLTIETNRATLTVYKVN